MNRTADRHASWAKIRAQVTRRVKNQAGPRRNIMNITDDAQDLSVSG